MNNLDRKDSRALAIEEVQFLERYLINFDLNDACDTIGLSIEQGERVLANPIADQIIKREQGFRFRRLSVTNSRTLLHIAEVAYRSPLLADDNTPEGQLRAAALESLEQKESTKALELLCKYADALKKDGKPMEPNADLVEQVSTIDAAADIAKRLLGAVKA